jgi:hypothetical protein
VRRRFELIAYGSSGVRVDGVLYRCDSRRSCAQSVSTETVIGDYLVSLHITSIKEMCVSEVCVPDEIVK